MSEQDNTKKDIKGDSARPAPLNSLFVAEPYLFLCDTFASYLASSGAWSG